MLQGYLKYAYAWNMQYLYTRTMYKIDIVDKKFLKWRSRYAKD